MRILIRKSKPKRTANYEGRQLSFREYRGKGTITLVSGSKINCEFILSHIPTKKPILICTSHDVAMLSLLGEIIQKTPSLKYSFEGLLEDSVGRITIDIMYCINFNISKELIYTSTFQPFTKVQIKYQQISTDSEVDYIAGLTNLLFIGTQWVTRANENMLSKIPLNIEGRQVSLELLEPYNDISKSLSEEQGVKVTAHLIIKAPISDITLIRDIFDEICVLLSFASGTWITWLYEDYFLENRLVETTLLASKTLPYNPVGRVIDTPNGSDLKEYLETTYSNYVQVKDSLGMNIVIEHYIYSKSVRIIELKYLIAAIGMECLISHLSDYFQVTKITADLSSLRNGLKALLEHFDIPYEQSDLDFIGIRDKIVHTGRFPPGLSPSQELEKLDNLYNLYDRTILTILGYRGKPYLNTAKKFTKELVP